MDVTDKIALVTGGSRGIGRGIALALAGNGADVVIADIDDDASRDVVKEVEELGRKAVVHHLDVTDQTSVDGVVGKIIDDLGRIDILVNNAGVIAAPGWETKDRPDEADWSLVHAVNVRGLARVTEAVTPHMKERRYGKIVNLASIAGRLGSVTSVPYSASKAGVINMTQAYALELAAFSINVNAICPGHLWTPMWERISVRWTHDPEKGEGLTPREIFDQTLKERVPLNREQTPEDVGHLACFLASDLARNITGQTVNVSGGSHLN